MLILLIMYQYACDPNVVIQRIYQLLLSYSLDVNQFFVRRRMYLFINLTSIEGPLLADTVEKLTTLGYSPI